MLNRIKWDEDTAQGRRQDKIDKRKLDINQPVEKRMNKCKLIWEVGQQSLTHNVQFYSYSYSITFTGPRKIEMFEKGFVGTRELPNCTTYSDIPVI